MINREKYLFLEYGILRRLTVRHLLSCETYDKMGETYKFVSLQNNVFNQQNLGSLQVRFTVLFLLLQ